MMARSGSPVSNSVLVVIVAYHGKKWLPACLDALAASSRNRLRLCLVDNSGNEDAIPKALSGFDYKSIATPSPMGFAEANNFALQRLGLESEFICFLNQDTLSVPGWIDACLSCFENDSTLGAVSPLLKTYDGTNWDCGFLECARASPALYERLTTNGILDTCYHLPRVTAAAMLVRGDALRKAGPFDPIFGSYYEDYDLCRRIREAGFQVGVATRGAVWHYSGSASTSEAARRKQMCQVVRNRALLRIRETPGPRWREVIRYLTCTMPYNIGRSIIRTPSSQPLPVQLRAHWNLLGEWRRLISERYDRRRWADYLSRLGWPQ